MIYIHIPFCKSRCLYCDFFSSTSSSLMDSFVASLQKEMDGRAEELRAARADTVYLGGGTPSQLGAERLGAVFDHLLTVVELESDAEVTLECNPDDVTADFLRGLRDTPVNRISMGVQTLDDGLLRMLRRRHTAREAREAVALLHGAGYTNLSLDLMYGLPGQTLEMWRRDVAELLSWGVPHLSAYSLQWEEGTPLYIMRERGEVEEASEELSLDMYRCLVASAREAGMEHYEISNFALPGRRSRHNSGYWRDVPYAGLGPGAHSYDGKYERSSNPPDLAGYIGAAGMPVRNVEILDGDMLYEERVLKSLRTAEGLDLASLSARHRDYALGMAMPHIRAGRMVRNGDVLRLTEEGIFVSNDVMSDMML